MEGNRGVGARVVGSALQVVAGLIGGGLGSWLCLLGALQIEIAVDKGLPFELDVWLLPMVIPVLVSVVLWLKIPRFRIAWISSIVGCLVTSGFFSLLLLSL